MRWAVEGWWWLRSLTPGLARDRSHLLIFFGHQDPKIPTHLPGTRWLDRCHFQWYRLMLFMESRHCPISSFPLYRPRVFWVSTCVLIWWETRRMSLSQWCPSVGHANWSTLWQPHNGAWLGDGTLTCPEQSIPWQPTHRYSLLGHKHNKSLRCLHRPSVCSVLELKKSNGIYTRWNKVDDQCSSTHNPGYSRSHSQAPRWVSG